MLFVVWAAVLFLDVRTISAGDTDGTCQDGWVRWTKFCYYFSSSTKSFGDSVTKCSQMSGYLTSIHSQQENAFLANGTNDEAANYWIGMDMKPDTNESVIHKLERWRWKDKTQVNFDNWPQKESDSDYACVVIKRKSGFWSNTKCTKKFRFICKKARREQLTVDETTSYYITTTTLDPQQISQSSPTLRQDGQIAGGQRKSGLGLYIIVAAGCGVAVVTVLVVGVIFCRWKKSRRCNAEGMLKQYVAPDRDFVYMRNEMLDAVDPTGRRPANKPRSPYESIDIEDFNVNDINPNGQTSASTPPTAILNADQQRVQSSTSAGNSNVDQNTAVLYAVPMKKNKKKPGEEQSPSPHLYDNNTMIEQCDNDLYASTGHDNEEFVDDDVIVVENDLSDQISVVL